EEQLYDFIQWGVQQYPAENYMVIVWGHGQGWGSGQINTTLDSVFAGRFGGLAFQENSDDFLTTPALSRVLEKVQNETFKNQKSIDIYASDACLMQMGEVAYELAPFTRYIVGSAQIQSYLGFPYRRMMYEINRGCYNQREEGSVYCEDNIGEPITRPDSVQITYLERVCGDDHSCYLAQMLPRLSHQSFHNQLGLQGKVSPESYDNMTMSSFNAKTLLQKVPGLMDQLAQSLIAYMESIEDNKRLELQKVVTESHKFLGEGREVGILLGHIEIFMIKDGSKEAHKVTETIIEFKSELNTLVLSHAYGNNYVEQGFNLLGAKSVALWIPSTENILGFRQDDFRSSRLYQDLEKVNGTEQSYWELWIERLLEPAALLEL
ncbi:MAG: hypothetical protein HRT44_11370, partial [Bdellovibrionales bacterium]|nr:clostripain-related cysteine peptidase [Bdellovibrionales bacterium]NQZ19841.1 hypothetical protein [Bdellovibrionales bacterium]